VRSVPGRRLPWGVLAGLVVVAALAYVVFALLRSLPSPTVTAVEHPARFASVRWKLAWPVQGEAAVGVQGIGLIGAHGSGRPTPIASIAKVMTAYVVLRDHPLHGGAGGPLITVTRADVAAYRAGQAAGQSVVAVRAGERLTERQALEGLLLPSGNNIAALLARWDAGSERAFVAKMNARARAVGLADTRYTGASGVQDSTVSTARDQVRLAMQVLKVRALRQTVAMAQARLPVAGRQDNRDALLGQDGIVGIKTGTTSLAGGCFVFAAHQRLAGRSITVVGAVLHQAAGQPQPRMIASAFHATRTLLASTRRVLVKRRVITRGATLARLTTPWTDRVALQAATSASLLGWRRLPIHLSITTASDVHAPIRAGQRVATAILTAGEQHEPVPLVASRELPNPSLTWRLAHP
jgi:D-alanyl-D-alanine carboxypeptidase (penicillin-binding protein 5/6)